MSVPAFASTSLHEPADVAALRAIVREAHATQTPLRIRGAGEWMDAGRPVHAHQQLSTRALSQVLEYVPDDLVITVGAGMTLRELSAITAAHDQWLALDPWGSNEDGDGGTIGATIATASHGPLSLGYGRARDLVLGIGFVTGDGTPVQAGGRVVKNVAGFDLVRMSTGAWGTLGVLTSMSLRLHARPADDATWVVPLESAASTVLSSLVSRLNCAPLLPYTATLSACLLLTHEAARTVGAASGHADAPAVLLARGTGNHAAVAAQEEALATVGPVTRVPSAMWRTVRGLDADRAVVRQTQAPLQTAATMEALHRWCVAQGASDIQLLGDPLRGTVRCSATLPAHPTTPASTPLPPGVIAERLPMAWWDHVPSAVGDPISQRLQQRFDPAGVLNPGILGRTASSTSAGAR
ncbi:MAG: FAD-binding protein [Gemmatimonadaceae bacterium]